MTHLRFARAQIDTASATSTATPTKIMHYAHLAAHEAPRRHLPGSDADRIPHRGSGVAPRSARRRDKANWLATSWRPTDWATCMSPSARSAPTTRPTNLATAWSCCTTAWSVAGYDKHFLPNYGVFDEFRIFAVSDRTVVLDIDSVRIGVAICERTSGRTGR